MDNQPIVGQFINTPQAQIDHDTLIRVDTNVQTILTQQITQDKEIAKLAVRVTSLEGFRWFILGGGGLLGFLAGLISNKVHW